MQADIGNFIRTQASAPFGRSLWFSNAKMQVYLRAGRLFSYTESGTVLALTISNVSVEEQYQRRGVFSTLVEEIIALGRELGYVEFQIENAISPEMLAFCKKHNLKMKPSPYGSAPSFWCDIEMWERCDERTSP